MRSQHPHAGELLEFYLRLLDLQEPLYRKAQRPGWKRAVGATDNTDARLRLERLPTRAREAAFVRFVRDVGAIATDVLSAVAVRLEAEPAATAAVLSAFLAARAVDELASGFDCDVALLEFFPRTFLQPIAQALVEGTVAVDADRGSSHAATCPRCGSPPLLAILRDEPEVPGRRLLLCSLCSAEWSFLRGRCPRCGEEQPDELSYHVSDAWPHVRIEGCGSCRTYVKAIDLRTDGTAVPEVDELAAVELDLWAGEQGLAKLQPNVLGL